MRIFPGLPFGNGSDGDYSSATIPTMTSRSCSGSFNSTTLGLSSAGFVNGDVLLIYQTRGSGAGNWEVNRIISGGGTTSLTLLRELANSYTDSGSSQAQCIKVSQYANVTVQSGTWSLVDWDGDVGGILTFACNGILTITGTISADSRGYRGGDGTVGSTPNYSGEGNNATNLLDTGDTGGSGGGTGTGGGGGGNGTAGSNGQTAGTNGGDTAGSADLITAVLGGAGGGGSSANEANGDGGDGGGFVLIFVRDITITGGVSASGGNGQSVQAGGAGGGGAGGSVLIIAQTATLGSNKITASAGSGGDCTENPRDGGAGGVGRISIHHSDTVTGTTSPTFNDTTDGSLKVSGGNFVLI